MNKISNCVYNKVMNEILYLILISILSVLVLFIISKLLGKKQIAQLEFIDYVMGISIGSIAAEMATDIGDKPFYYYIISMFIIFLVDVLFSFVSRKTPKLKHFFNGKPITLIYDGEIKYDALKRSKLDINDLLGLCREQGYFDISKIAYAIFENNGQISLMPKMEDTPIVAKDMQIKVDKPGLSYYLVADGRISYSSLNELKKDKEWLYDQLHIVNDKQLKNILLAQYDDKNKKMMITTKN
jgi:uncharacterized membrane protein YcaP (DUF421 family)